MSAATVITSNQSTFADRFRSFHDCPNVGCLTLYFIATTAEAGLQGFADADWPLCLLCNRCLVEPEIWQCPLEPADHFLCAACLVNHSDPPVTYGGFGSEAEARMLWIINELTAGRDIDQMRPFPADSGNKRAYTGPKGEGLFTAVKTAVPIEVLAARFTNLLPSGPNHFKARCPLHTESTPSFHIWTDKGTWRCFGACAMGGDVITLAQELINHGLPV